MVMSILPKFLTLKWNILRTIWRIEVGDGLLFCIFHDLSFELNFYFDRRFPLTASFFMWERNFEVTFGIVSVLASQINVFESYLDIYLFKISYDQKCENYFNFGF